MTGLEACEDGRSCALCFRAVLRKLDLQKLNKHLLAKILRDVNSAVPSRHLNEQNCSFFFLDKLLLSD